MKNKAIISCFLFAVYFLLPACGGDDDDTIAPKPRAFFLLSYPEKTYVKYDSVLPFTFEMPTYSKIVMRKSPDQGTEWFNLDFPSFNGTVNFTYKELKGNLEENTKETYDYVTKHQVKASGIEEQLINKDSLKVYGLLYNIGGNAASSVQFFLTDSSKHFLRGALYFNAVPNTDSIQPVVDYVRKDIYHMIETFKWKEKSGKGDVIRFVAPKATSGAE